MFPPCQASSCLGSFCGRSAFMGKSVFGKFSVFFSSSGSAMIGALVNPFHAVLVYRYTAGNIGKQCKDVCYNEWQSVSAAWGAQPFPASANHNGQVHRMRGICV